MTLRTSTSKRRLPHGALIAATLGAAFGQPAGASNLTPTKKAVTTDKDIRLQPYSDGYCHSAGKKSDDGKANVLRIGREPGAGFKIGTNSPGNGDAASHSLGNCSG